MNEKLNFIIDEDLRPLRTHQIADLCDYLTAEVLEPLFTESGHRWNRRFMNFIGLDPACNPLEPTGTIHFQVPGLFAGQVGALQSAAVEALASLSIKTGPTTFRSAPQRPHERTIVIPVLENPTVLISPPDVNMSFSRGIVVMRDILGYRSANGRYEFAADDLLQRVSAVSEERIAACSASPLAGPEGVRRTPSAVTMKSFRRCLDEIRQFALWATQHNYQALAAT